LVMPDIPANNELLTKILERLDQLDEKFTGQIQSVRGEVQAVGKRVDQLDEKFTGQIQSVRGEVQAVGKRVDQLDEKFTGEIRQLDQKFTGEIQSVRGEIQAARKEARDFHDSAKETWGHLERVVTNSENKRAAYEQKMDRRWDEQQRGVLEIWYGIRDAMEKDGRRTLNYEKALARVNEEIEELKRDKAVKEAILQDLQQRLIKIETAQNIAN